MSSLHHFRTVVVPFGGGDCRIRIVLPLRVDAARPDIGWTTEITFHHMLLSFDTKRTFASVRRMTTPVALTSDGRLRRRFKDQPVTVDSVTVRLMDTVAESQTSWLDDAFSSTDTDFDFRFDPSGLLTMLTGCRESGEVLPLLDWLVESSTGFAPFISEAGWLPATWDEFEAVREERVALDLDAATEEEGDLYPEEQDDGSDRWR